MSKYQFIESALRELCLSHQASNSKRDRSQLRHMINKCIRIIDMSCVLDQASHKAINLARQNNIDLSVMNWNNQPKFDPGRKLFVFEHKTPINMLVEKMIQKPNEILQVLEEMDSVWITREEDNMLNSLGYRTKRPDPDKAYSEASITIASIE